MKAVMVFFVVVTFVLNLSLTCLASDSKTFTNKDLKKYESKKDKDRTEKEKLKESERKQRYKHKEIEMEEKMWKTVNTKDRKTVTVEKE